MQKTLLIIILLFLLSITIHLVPFLLYHAHPLGYDTGFYRRYLIQPFDSFPNSPVPGFDKDALLPRIFLDTIRVSHLPADSILYGSYLLLFALHAIPLFFLVRHYWNASTGFFAAILLIISPIQYTAYWFMLYKNAFALPLLLTAFLLLEWGSKFAIPFGIIIAFSHHTTSIIFLTTVTLFAVLNRQRRTIALQTLAATSLAFFFLHYSSISDYVNSPIAVFMDRKEYLILSSPLFILAWFGIQKFVVQRFRSVIVAFFVVTAAFPFFSLPFYKRIFVFTDIAVIMAAAAGCQTLYQKIKNEKEKTTQYGLIMVSGMLIGLIALSTYGRIENLRPLVSSQELHELDDIARNVPPDATILTSTALAPWVHGWSLNKIVASGLLHDTRTAEEWALFWTGDADAKKKFLHDFQKPLYIFVDPTQKEMLTKGIQECLSKKTQFLLLYTC